MRERHQEAAVISPDFCSARATTLTISKGSSILSDEKYVVRDVNDSVVLRVVGYPFSLHTTRVILDAADRPIVTLRQEIFSAYDGWKVFRGESSDPKDLIFSTKRSSFFQLDMKLHVFLARNEAENVCDYALKARGWFKRSCAIYAGDSESSTVIAQMERESIFIGNHKLMVTMNPNVDCAFVVALVIIFEEIKSQGRPRRRRTPEVPPETACVFLVFLFLLLLVSQLPSMISNFLLLVAQLHSMISNSGHSHSYTLPT